MNRAPRIWLVLMVGALLVTGCEQTGMVRGLVTLDGEPLTTGVITFNPKAGGPSAYGAIGTDGRYELHVGGEAGLAAGEYVVTVAANASTPAVPEEPAAPPTEGQDASPAGPPVLPLLTPQKYSDLASTPLRATIKGGEQTLEFHLASE